MSGSSKTPIYGPEPWATRNKTVWSYWDLWFGVVALADYDGDLDELTVAIEEGGRLSGGGTAEAKLSHLDDLRRRMARPASTHKRSSQARTPIRRSVPRRERRCSSRRSTRAT
jgi:hypothetical protein